MSTMGGQACKRQSGQPLEARLASGQSGHEEREITLLAGETGLKDLDHTTDVCLVGIRGLMSAPEGACQLDACERLVDAFLNAIKHPSDDG